MRNLKKIVAVLLAVALLASMMVTALAAVTNTDKALKLQSIGLMAGTEADLKLEEGLNRIQGLTFAIRAAGKEAEALAMTADEVAAQLAGYTDAKDIPDWNGNGPKYVAYAIKNQITVGVGNNKFAPLAPISGPSFLVFLLKSSMGYTEATTATSLVDLVVDAGILTPGQAVAIYNNNSLIRDDAAGVLFAAVSTGVNKDGTTLIASLIKSGAVTEAKAVAAGFATATPTALEVVSAAGTNLKEIVVKFNMALDAAKVVVGNFTVGGNAASAVALSTDKTEVTVTTAAKANGSDYALVVKKDVGLAAEYSKTVRIIDNTIPTVADVKVTGPRTLEVIFSEPVTGSGSVLVNNGIYGSSAAAPVDNKVVVTLGSDLANGSYEVKVTGYKDFAGYSMDTTTKTVAFAKDASPLTVKIVEAKQNSVKIEFSKALKVTPTVNHFYHTFSAWTPNSVTGSGTTWTLSFTTYTIPEGNFNLTVKTTDGTTKLADVWSVELAADQTLSSSVTADKTAPTVSLNKVEAEDKILVDYSEAVTGATTADNYVLKNADGTTVADVTITPTLKEDNTYNVGFSKKLPGGNYILVVSNIKDTALAPNAMAASTVAFTVTDLTAPTVSKVEYVKTAAADTAELVYISFDEAMGASVTDLNNYRAAGVKPTAISVFGTNKYKLEFPHNTTVEAVSGFVIGQLVDVAGNKMPDLSYTTSAGIAATPNVSSVKTLTKNTIEIVVNSVIPTLSASDIIVTKTGYATPEAVAMISFSNDGSETTIVATLTANTAMAKTDEVPAEVAVTVGALKADTGMANAAAITTAAITDGIAPEFNAYVTGSGILDIDFSEALTTTAVSFAANDLVIKVGTKTLVAGLDYTTAVTSTTAIRVTFAVAPAAGDKVTVNSAAAITYIKDTAGNAAKAFTTAKELTY